MAKDDDQARLVRAFTAMLRDALDLALTIAVRSGENFQGEEGLFRFNAIADDIRRLQEGVPMKALREYGVPPSLLTAKDRRNA